MTRHAQTRTKEVVTARVVPKNLALESLLRPSAVEHMQRTGIDAWYTFHIPHSTPNPTALRLFRAIGIKNLTAPVMGFVYPDRIPVLIVAGLEEAHYKYFSKYGEVIVVNSRAELEIALKRGMEDCRKIALEYDEGLIATSHSIIPASLLDLIRRSAEIAVVSSGDLIQAQIAVLSKEGLASHERAANIITGFIKEAFAFISSRVGRVTEYEVQQFLANKFTEAKLTCEGEPPIVAVNANAANPHYALKAEGSAVIKRGDLVLFDFWAREAGNPEAIYADLGWMAYVGKKLPPTYARAFHTLLNARDAALEHMQNLLTHGHPLEPFQIDSVARNIITDAGYPNYPHSTGHSITTLVHGEGVTVGPSTSYRGVDRRLLLPGCLVSDEPGIYVKGRYGMRIESDIYVDPVKGPRVTSEIQREMVLI
ncbi:MAG: M24 family metallopeptidase [Candidatus Micrarchaeota archaeon]|nr:M24 family metallopeptidase [Candidatus Micrarchaeota archaeon]